MSKRFVKAESLADPQGANDVGVDTADGLAGPKVRNALIDLLSKVNTRLFGVEYEGSTQTYRKYVNFKGNVSVADNAAGEATDVTILEQDFRWMGVWSGASVSYLQDDFVTRLGNMYRSRTSHTSNAGAPPETNTTDWEIAVTKGADGAGPGGVHGSTHKGDGSDPIPAATTSVNGLMGSADKTKLDGIQANAKNTHNDLSGLTTGDPHTQYALADGTRLVVASSVSSPTLNQLRESSGTLQRWNGSAWVSVRADIDPASPLGVDSTDMAAGHSVIIHVTSLTRPTSAIEGQIIYETDTELYYKNVSDTATPEWLALVPEITTYTPSWVNQSGAGSTFAAFGDGNPNISASLLNVDLPAYPTPSHIGTLAGRCVRFRLPKTLAVASAWLLPRNSTTSNIFKVGIYRASDGVKLYDSGLFNLPTAHAWRELVVTGVTLAANTNYWYVITTNSTSTSSFFRSLHSPETPNQYAATGPLSGLSTGLPEYGEITLTTAGTLPDPMPTVNTPQWTNTTGTLPFMFLEGSAS